MSVGLGESSPSKRFHLHVVSKFICCVHSAKGNRESASDYLRFTLNTVFGSTISRKSRVNPAVCLRGWTLGPHVCSDLARVGEARAPCPSRGCARAATLVGVCPESTSQGPHGSVLLSRPWRPPSRRVASHRAPFLHRPPPGAAGTREEGFLSGLLSLPAASAAEPGRSGWAGAALGRSKRALPLRVTCSLRGRGPSPLTSASLGAECAS